MLIPVYGDFTWKGWLLDITCIAPHNWYLNIILLCYIVFFIVSFKNVYRYRYVVLGVFSALLFFFGDGLWAEQAISFILGVWISDNRERVQKCIENNFILLGLFAVSGALLVLKQIPAIRAVDDTYIWYVIQLLMKTALALGIVGFTYRASKFFDNRFLAFIGGISLEIYLVHFKLLFILHNNMNVFMQIPLFIVCSIFGAWLFNLCVRYGCSKIQKVR